MKLAKGVVKHHVLIVIVAIALMVPALFGMIATRINYDMLTYLPEDMDTVKGQNVLLEDFGKGAFAFIIVENQTPEQISALKAKVQAVDHVETVLWYDSLADVSIPMELLPDEIYEEFNTDHSTLMAVFFDTSTSSDLTIEAIREVRSVTNEHCFISGMSALVTDLKQLCEKEEPIYVAIAVILACIAMIIFLDNWIIPFVFLASIGNMILLNLGTNIFMGEISYITKALSAVLQLAVTMDYSIFLWHSYNEKLDMYEDKNEAMAYAIDSTLTSVTGSSITTVAGFLALIFMTFTLGRDLGIVMAKGVLLGVIGCVTVLPSLILILDKPLRKCSHRSLITKTEGFSRFCTKIFPVFLVLLVVVTIPAYYGYNKTNNEVYYNLVECLPQDLDCAIANNKLSNDFNIASTHLLLVNSKTSSSDVRAMVNEMKQVDGIKYVLGLESVIGPGIPIEILPEKLTSALQNENWKLYMINSTYTVASNEVNDQVDTLNAILKKYDDSAMLIGEAPCMKDMIVTTDHDFRVVNAISIIAIFIIIALVERSISLPFILIAVIELAIFINLGLPHFLGQSLPFIAPICISTIQLGATVDYAILMTTRYKTERIAGNSKHSSIVTALSTSIPSILVSGFGLFAATFGVAIYSDIDIISSICMLLARGAIVSMVCVVLFLPALLMLFDKIVCYTTFGMNNIGGHNHE